MSLHNVLASVAMQVEPPTAGKHPQKQNTTAIFAAYHNFILFAGALQNNPSYWVSGRKLEGNNKIYMCACFSYFYTRDKAYAARKTALGRL